MTHIPHEHSASTEPTLPVDGRVEQEVRQFTYDPALVRDLHVEAIREIEDAIIAAGDEPDATPDHLQSIAMQKLQALGIDPSMEQGGFVVARVVSPDGKAELRAVNIDYADFGTRVRNAELVEQPEAAVEGASDKDDELDRRRVEAISEDLNARISRVENALGDRRPGVVRQVSDVADQVKLFARRLSDPSEQVDRRQVTILASQIEELAGGLRINSDSSADAATAIRAFGDGLEDAAVQSNRMGESQAVVKEGLARAAAVQDELFRSLSLLAADDQAAFGTTRSISAALDELLYSRSGHESFGYAIGRLAQQLKESLDGAQQRPGRVEPLINELRQHIRDIS